MKKTRVKLRLNYKFIKYKYTNIQIYKYTNIQIYKYTNIQIYK